MLSLTQLWVPILLSAVAVFVASSVIHVASPWHRGDYPRMHNEAEVMDAMRPLAIPPGDYLFPRPTSMADMKSPEFGAKLERGPNVLMTVMPNGPVQMGGTFVQWMVYLLVVSLLVAIAALGIRPGARHLVVFHQTALVAFAAYALALWQLTIWYRRSLSISVKWTVDAAIYAAITGAVFVLFWPA